MFKEVFNLYVTISYVFELFLNKAHMCMCVLLTGTKVCPVYFRNCLLWEELYVNYFCFKKTMPRPKTMHNLYQNIFKEQSKLEIN